MIEKSRLEELIEQGATIYYISEDYIKEIDFSKIVPNKFYYDGFNYYDKYDFSKDEIKVFCEYEKLYEFKTKEDAEFVLKNHTSKTLYFRPPTFDEFLKTRREGIYAHWYCGDICIVMEEDNQQKGILRSTNAFRVDDENNYESFKYEYDEWLDNRKEVYEKAVEYARKLFLGEVEDA